MIRRVAYGLIVFFAVSIAFADDLRIASLNKDRLHTKSSNKISSVLSTLEQRLITFPKDHEASLLKAILFFKAGNFDQALTEINQLIKKVPDFRLAHLVKGDFLLSRFRAVNNLGQNGLLASLETTFSNKKKQELYFLREEAQLRLKALLSQPADTKLPRQILELGDSVESALVVDKSDNRLYIFSRQSDILPLKHTADYYVSTGKLKGNKIYKGDLRTPEGVYFVTSWISPDKLPDKYGIGAFPVNYPNELDRKEGKTGYGIWLHGTDTGYYSRPPRDSEGCVVLSNTDLSLIKNQIKPGITPVIITESIDWVDLADWQSERKDVLDSLEKWRSDWESMNVDDYLSHYDTDFWTKSHNKKSWSNRKRQLMKSKTRQDIKLSDISMFAYQKSEDKDLVVVRFRQDYRSNNFTSDIYKRLYLKKSEAGWKIVYEGS